MERFKVTGMSCAACSARVEKAVSKLEGVKSCSVSLLTNSMAVEGEAAPEQIIAAVEKAGYEAELKHKEINNTECKENGQVLYEQNDDIIEDKETARLKKRLFLSLSFLVVLMYFSMGHMMWNWPIPKFFDNNHIAMGLLQMLLTISIMIINQKFFVSGFNGLIHGAPNMDTLVALGSGSAFVYSTYALFAMTGAQLNNDSYMVMSYMHEFYFESAAMILTLITVGKTLEAKSKGRTTNALKSLMKLAPKTARVENNGVETQIPISNMEIGMIFIVRPGDSIPCDGIIIDGNTAIDESALTGESIPVDKNVGDEVSAATVNQSGFIRCRATRVGADTTLSQIIQMVSDASATKAPIAKVADKVSGVFVPTVIIISIVTFVIWILVGQTFGFALARAISVLVISCPCALGLATPVAIMVGNGMGAKNGILFKNAESLEVAGKIEVVALDKTGTITKGAPVVTDVITAKGITKDKLIYYAAALEKKSEHPLAKAIVEYACDVCGISYDDNNEIRDFSVVPGKGLTGAIEESNIVGGSVKYINEIAGLSQEFFDMADNLSAHGKTPLIFAKDAEVLGIVAVADVIKEDSEKAVKELKKMGLKVVMLTGDNEKTAGVIGSQVGVDEVVAGVLPDGKENIVRQMQKSCKVAMVGDGINDAPALTRADAGIAIGAGTDIAIDAADIVLVKNSLMDVATAIRLSRATIRNIHENLFWAFFYNIIGIPLAAGVWIHLTGWQMNPMFGAAAMSLSSVCVVTNALRLNLFKIKEKELKKSDIENGMSVKKREENKTMTKIMKIEGMMCGHCEARVKKTLEAIDQVTEAVVSHENGTACITLSADVDNNLLKDAVEAQDYKVIDIQ